MEDMAKVVCSPFPGPFAADSKEDFQGWGSFERGQISLLPSRATGKPSTRGQTLLIWQCSRPFNQPSRPKRDLFVDRAPSDLDSQLHAAYARLQVLPEHQFAGLGSTIPEEGTWSLCSAANAAEVHSTAIGLNGSLKRSQHFFSGWTSQIQVRSLWLGIGSQKGPLLDSKRATGFHK